MGLIFDALMILYFCLAVFTGYRRGFLLSVSGIAAFIISTLIYRIFELEYIYFIVIYILLIIAIAVCAKLIRKLRVPILAKTDAILGTVLGIFNGLLGITVISALMLIISSAGGGDALESSFILKIAEGILPV
jgi:Na+-translocating ferredoxin:NAD+ oxidoreductase RnfA subunit